MSITSSTSVTLCVCGPPGSGEEFCNGACYLAQVVDDWAKRWLVGEVTPMLFFNEAARLDLLLALQEQVNPTSVSHHATPQAGEDR